MLQIIQGITTGQWVLIALGLISLVEVVPIKINPWSKLVEWIGKRMNKPVLEKLEDEAEEVKDLKARSSALASRMDRKDAEDARNHILRFGDEIKNGVRHSQEYFNQILDDITKYEQYCREHPNFKNKRTEATEKIIEGVYRKCIKENDFL